MAQDWWNQKSIAGLNKINEFKNPLRGFYELRRNKRLQCLTGYSKTSLVECLQRENCGMCTKLVVLVTLLPMLIHSILGCCWHHAHFDQSDVFKGQRLQADIHPHECTHNHCSGNVGKKTPKSPVPAPCKHHAPCEEVRCEFLAEKSLRVVFALTMTSAFVALEANWSVMLRNPLKSWRTLANSRELPTSQEHCALIQVWIV